MGRFCHTSSSGLLCFRHSSNNFTVFFSLFLLPTVALNMSPLSTTCTTGQVPNLVLYNLQAFPQLCAGTCPFAKLKCYPAIVFPCLIFKMSAWVKWIQILFRVTHFNGAFNKCVERDHQGSAAALCRGRLWQICLALKTIRCVHNSVVFDVPFHDQGERVHLVELPTLFLLHSS